MGGKRNRIWAQQARTRLIERLGGECVICKRHGQVKRPGPLTFDIIIPFDYGSHHKGNAEARMRFYHKQEKAKNVQLLCHYHNSKKGLKDRLWLQFQAKQPDCPF